MLTAYTDINSVFARNQETIGPEETLADMPQRVDQAGLTSSCLTVIGEVVNLHDSLAWFKPQSADLGATPAAAPVLVESKRD